MLNQSNTIIIVESNGMEETNASVFRYGTNLTVSCMYGYAFSAVEFNSPDNKEPKSEVKMMCLAGGKWNIGVKPHCRCTTCPL